MLRKLIALFKIPFRCPSCGSTDIHVEGDNWICLSCGVSGK